MEHVDAETAERASGIATPEPNGIVQYITHTTTATAANRKVNKPNFTLASSKNVALRTSIDIGKNTKKPTEA
jgi:hypothetical protein